MQKYSLVEQKSPGVQEQGTPRIVFINRYFYPDQSATAQLLTDLAFGLAANGWEIHVVCARQLYDAPEARLPGRETIRGVIVHRIWTTRFGRAKLSGRALDYISFYFACTIALLRLLRRDDVVVAKTDPPLISIVAFAIARLKRAILVNWLQDIFPEVASRLGTNLLPCGFDKVLRYLRDVSLRAAAMNVVLGSRMQEYLSGRHLPPQNIRIMENWADADLVRPQCVRDSRLRAQMGLAEKFVVGYSGNLGRVHEYNTLLGAAESLRIDERVAFLFIGGGVKMDGLKAAVAQRQLQSFNFLPYQPRENLQDSLAAADVHLASLIPAMEGLIVPSKFYGILAAGRPIIFVGDGDGELARVIRAAGCGLAVETDNAAELSAAIRELQVDKDRRHAMGVAARELLCSKFSSKRALDGWAKLLVEVQRLEVQRRKPKEARISHR
jgi:colanic acid biosynthesis glycosyl transferase WcaI